MYLNFRNHIKCIYLHAASLVDSQLGRLEIPMQLHDHSHWDKWISSSEKDMTASTAVVDIEEYIAVRILEKLA